MWYAEIGITISKVVWFIGTVIMFVKPLLSWTLPKIGFKFDNWHEADTAYQELCYTIFHDEDASPAKKAGGWLLFVTATQLALAIASFFIVLIWPLGILFLIVWVIFSKINKNKED